MKKTKIGKLSFPKAPVAIGERALANVTGGTTSTTTTTIVPCVRPGSIEPCFYPGTIIPCIRPR